MTATQIQFRRGSAAQMATFTGAVGEVVVDTTNNRVVVQDGTTAGGWPAARIAEVNPQCGRLSYVNPTQIKFAPYNGGNVKIAGALYQIPAAGITAANTSVYVNGTAGQNLAASTLYYVYLFNNAGTLTVDFSTTSHATDTATGNVGVEIKSGDNSRTLIGMVYTNGSAQFSGALLVASWLNRQTKVANAAVANSTTTSTSIVTFGSNVVSALTWADDALWIGISAYAFNSVTGDYGIFFIQDQNNNGYLQETSLAPNNNINPFVAFFPFTPVAGEGYYSLALKALSEAAANTFTMVNIQLFIGTRS